MKGISSIIILGVLVTIVGLLLSVFILPTNDFYEQTRIEEGSIEDKLEYDDGFDYTTYVTSHTTDLETYDECEKLKNAIKNSILRGKPQKVDQILYDEMQDFPLLGDCLEDDITIDVANGLEQTLCRFETINENVHIGIEYGGISDSAMLYYDKCEYDYNSLNVLPFFSSINQNVIGPEDEEINMQDGKINLFYSPDHMYLENADFSHKLGTSQTMFSNIQYLQAIRNVSAFDNSYLGKSNINIYVGNVQNVNGVCKFNMYMCPRAIISESTASSLVGIFNIFRKLNTNPIVLPYYIRDLTEFSNKMQDYSNQVYYWNTYEVDLEDEEYDVEAIVNAIKSGLYFNINSKGYYFAHPHWDIKRIDQAYTNEDRNKVIIDIAVVKGSGRVCVKVPNKLDQCTSESMVAKFDVGDEATFEFYGDLEKITSNTGSAEENFTKEIENMDGYIAAYFAGPEDKVSYTFSVASGSGRICVVPRIAYPSVPLGCTSNSMTLKLNAGQRVDVKAYSDDGFVFDRFEYREERNYYDDTFTLTADKDGSFVDALFSGTSDVIINSECWNTLFDEAIISDSEWDRTRSIRYNCGSDNVCSESLKIKIAIRKDTRWDLDIDGDGLNDEATYVSGIFSFCGA